MILIFAACAAGVLGLASAAGDAPVKPSTEPAMFETSRARGNVGHPDMEPSDPRHQNLPSPEEVTNHFRAKSWSESELASIPAAEIATAAAGIEQHVICSCGCPRQSIYDCNCRTAAELRGRVLDEFARLGRSAFDLKTDTGRTALSQEIVRLLDNDAGNTEGAQDILTPVFVVLALGLVFVMVAVRRRRARSAGDRDPTP